MTISSPKLTGEQTLKVTVDVTNTSDVAGKEVVQLYIRDVVGSVTRPVKELKGFKKLLISGGETKTVSFEITPEDLKFYNADLDFVWEPGEFEIMVGTNSRDVISSSVYWNK